MAAPGQGGVVGTAGAGGAPGPDGNWRAPNFRAKVVAQINDALKDACNPIEKSGNELENHIFNRAKDRDSYLSLVARLILHMRDSNAAKEKGRMTPNMAGQQQDPMIALQGLTQMGQTQSSGMQMQPNPNQMVPGVVTQGNRPINRNQMPQPQGGNIMDQRQQQMAHKLQKMMSSGAGQTGASMPGASMAQGVPQAVPQGVPQNVAQGGVPQGVPPQAVPQGVPQPVPQSQQSQMPHFQGAVAAGMPPGNFAGPAGGAASGMTPQPQPGMPGGPPGGPQGAQPQQGMHMTPGPGPGVVPGQMGMQQPGMMPQQMQQMPRPQQQQSFGNQMVMQQQNPQAQMQARPQVARTFSGQATPPVQNVMTDSPAYRQQPSPAQSATRGPTPGSNPLHSPASYFQPSPSPQGHSIPSPASAGSQRGEGPPSVPSPSSTLNTPGNPSSVGSVNPSPGGGVRGGPGSNQSQTDSIAFQEKFRQLSKYIEPLKRAIQTHKDEADAKEIKNMQYLLGILTNALPNKRWTLQHLVRCEQMLENYEQQMKLTVPGSHATSSATTTSTTTTVSSLPTADSKVAVKSGNMFQPLLDAVRAHINSPTVNHSLQRTFGPALATLQGSPPQFPSPPKKLKTDHDPSPTTQPSVPDIVQGEVARLSPKFRVNLDPMFHCSGKEVHLICRLDDKYLPSVPPISISIPDQYPDLSPSYDVSPQEYGQTPFLKLVQVALSNQIMRMPNRFTLTQVLDAWEMSIRKSCLTMMAARDGT